MTTPASHPDDTDGGTANTTDPEESIETPSDTSDSDEYTYSCPHCEETYSDEDLTRVHITRADDKAHENRSGLMPEAQIEVLNADGTIVETRSRHPKEIDLSTIDLDTFPEELSAERRHVLVVASQNPEITNCRELHRMVTERLSGGESDVEPSYWTVRHAINDFYHPSETEDTTTRESKTLSDLPLKKRAIVTAQIVSPDASNSELSDIADCAPSYPGTVLEEESHVLDRLNARLEDGETPTAIIKDELSVDALEEMLAECRMAELPLELTTLAAEMAPDDASSTETDDKEPATQDAEVAETDRQWGTPTGEHGVMGAAPPDPFGGVSDDDHAGENATQRTLADTDTAVASDEQPDATHDAPTATGSSGSAEQSAEELDSGSEASETDTDGLDESSKVSPQLGAYDSDVITEVQLLYMKVRFLRRTVSQTAHPGGLPACLLSSIEQIERDCKAILQAYNQG